MGTESGRALAGRAAGYAGEQVVRLAITAAVGVVVARYLGPDGLGLLSYAQSVFSLLLPLVMLGFPAILVREFSSGTEWRGLLASAVGAQIPVAVVVAIVGFVAISATRPADPQALLIAAALIPLPLLSMHQTVRAYLEASGRARIIVVVGVTASAAAAAFKIAAVVVGADIWVFALAGTAEAAFVLGGLLIGLPGRKRLNTLRRHFRPQVARDLTRESWPLLLAGLAVTVYLRIDIVMLGVILGDRDAGIYTAAVRLSEVWYFLPLAAVAAVRPMLSRLHAAGASDEYVAHLRRLMTAAVATSYLAIGFVVVGGPFLIGVLYGPAYAESTPVLRLHVLAAPFVFLGVTAGPWFVDRRLTRAVLVRSSTGAGVNVALNLLLIPSHGPSGAAVATIISYAMSSVFLNGLTSVGRPVLRLQLKALALRWTPQRHDRYSPRRRPSKR